MSIDELDWQPQGDGAFIARRGAFIVGMIVPLAVAPGGWAYSVDGLYLKWNAKMRGQVKDKRTAQRAAERAWKTFIDLAGLRPPILKS